MSAELTESEKRPQSFMRTRYFRFVFAIGFVIFTALFIAFYRLVFGAIDNALSVQSRFFVERVTKNIEREYSRIKRESAVLRSNRLVQQYLLRLSAELQPADSVKERIESFLAWWLAGVDNPIYYGVSYLDLSGQPILVYPVVKEVVTQVNRDLSNLAETAAGTGFTTKKLQRMIEQSLPLEHAYDKNQAYTLILSDSTRLLRFIKPIKKRKTEEILGYLAIDVHLEDIFGMDVEADRTLLVSENETLGIVHDALHFDNPQDQLQDRYSALYEALKMAVKTDTLDVSVVNKGRTLNTFSIQLADPAWTITAMVDNSEYMDEPNSKGLLLIIASLFFVTLSGFSIIILSRRVEERTEGLIEASHLISAQNKQLEEELMTARELQMGLMPNEAPTIAGIEVAGKCQTATQVGGDFFQYFPISDKRLAIAMADVTGHGMRAAVPTMVLSGLLDNQMAHSDSIQDLFSQLNQSLHKVLEKRTFICFAMGEVDIEKGKVRIANGGCPYPYFYHASDGTVEELNLDALPLGIRAGSEYLVREMSIEEGDRIIWCSDGIIEASNRVGELFGFERTADTILLACKRDLGAEDLLEFVFKQVEAHAGDMEQEDDQTVVVLQMI